MIMMLKKYEQRSLIVIALIVGAIFFGVYLRLWDLSSVLTYSLYFLLAGVVGVFLLGFRERIENAVGKKPVTPPEVPMKIAIDDNLVYLAIHYPRIKSKADVPDATRLRYVTDNRNKIAFRVVPDWLEPSVREHKINWQVYDDENALRKYIVANFPLILEGTPNPGQLGLKYHDGVLTLAEDRYAGLMSKLKGHKLEDLEIVYLRRARFFFPPARRILLLKRSAKEAWLSPPCEAGLVANGIVDSEVLGMHFWETCKGWCKCYNGYTFIKWHYPESQLLEGV